MQNLQEIISVTDHDVQPPTADEAFFGCLLERSGGGTRKRVSTARCEIPSASGVRHTCIIKPFGKCEIKNSPLEE